MSVMVMAPPVTLASVAGMAVAGIAAADAANSIGLPGAGRSWGIVSRSSRPLLVTSRIGRRMATCSGPLGPDTTASLPAITPPAPYARPCKSRVGAHYQRLPRLLLLLDHALNGHCASEEALSNQTPTLLQNH